MSHNKTKTSRRGTFVILLLLVLSSVSLPACAQKMWVKEFKYVDDPTAILEGTSKTDVDGKTAALIKVISKLSGRLSFDVGTLGIVDDVVEKAGGETWVYVRAGTKKITVKCNGYDEIRNYKFGIDIREGATYELTIDNDVVTTNRVYDQSRTQKARVNVYPSDAKVLINNIPTVNNDGVVESVPLGLGVYSITVSADKYHTYNGDIELNGDGGDIKDFSLRLRPKFGWLTIEGKNLDDVSVVVDDTTVVAAPLNNILIPSGKHKVAIRKPLCAVNDHDIIMTDSAFMSITPVFISDFASLTLSVGGGAEIFIDGESKGFGRWKGDIGSGKHTVECRKPSHRTTVRNITITKNNNENITLDEPTPIYGHLELLSNVDGASVLIDGSAFGSTPISSSSNVLIGEHKVEVSKPGYRTETRDVEIKENETCSLNISMANVATVTIASSPSNAFLTIDGKSAGYTSYSKEMTLGTYSISLSKYKYKTITRRLTVDGTKSSYSFNLKRIYYKSNSMYIEGFGQVGSMLAAGGAIGGYIHNVNVELNYVYGLSESETIYWNENSESGEDYSYYGSSSSSATYKATTIGGRVGYGFVAGNRLRITPQVGCGVTTLNSSVDDIGDAPAKTYSVYVSGGVRFNYAILSWLGLSVTPEYSKAMKKGEIYEQMSEVSSDIKSLGEGFNCKIGLNVFF